jgi:broad specificity phosphatase PhoE
VVRQRITVSISQRYRRRVAPAVREVHPPGDSVSAVAKLYVVRHAQAGDRSSWNHPDELRPLSPRGARQAAGLCDVLADTGVKRLVSSPAIRCIDTLRPLGDALGLEVEVDERLAEGADGRAALGLLAELASAPAAVCSHGDVIPDVLDELVARGVRFSDDLRWQKGSTWELTWNGSDVTRARYVPPPS